MYLVIEIYNGAMQLEHNAIVTPEELIKHFPDAIISVMGTMDDSAAEALTFTERGLAHLDESNP